MALGIIKGKFWVVYYPHPDRPGVHTSKYFGEGERNRKRAEKFWQKLSKKTYICNWCGGLRESTQKSYCKACVSKYGRFKLTRMFRKREQARKVEQKPIKSEAKPVCKYCGEPGRSVCAVCRTATTSKYHREKVNIECKCPKCKKIYVREMDYTGPENRLPLLKFCPNCLDRMSEHDDIMIPVPASLNHRQFSSEYITEWREL